MDKQEIAKRLHPWQEIAGELEAIQEEDGLCIACLSGSKVLLPEEMADELRGYLGKRIAVLRTDADYRIRELPPLLIDHVILEVHLSEPIASAGM